MSGIARKAACGLALVATMATMTATATAASRPQDRAALARSLASGLERATTEPARVKAIERIWRAFDIPVFDRGKATYSQVDRDPRESRYGRAELVLLARAHAADRPVTLARLAGRLGGAGVRGPKGAALSEATLATALRSSITAAKRRRRAAAGLLGPLLAELAKRGPTRADLAAASTGAGVALDPVGAHLLLVAAERQARPRRRSSRPRAAQAAAARCPGKYASRGGLTGALDALSSFAFGSSKPTLIRQYAREELLRPAASIKRVVDDTVATTDFGPLGHPALSAIAGRDVRIVYEARIDYPPDLATDACGSLADAGIRLPPNGPLAGVPFDWPPAPPDGEPLEKYGTVVRKDAKTGADGRAVFQFHPLDELAPGEGDYQQATAAVVAALDLDALLGGRPDDVTSLVQESTSVVVGYRRQTEIGIIWKAHLKGASRVRYRQICQQAPPEVFKDDRSQYEVGSSGSGTLYVFSADGRTKVRSRHVGALPGDLAFPGSTLGLGSVAWSRLTPSGEGCTASDGSVACAPQGNPDLLSIHTSTGGSVTGARLEIDIRCPTSGTGDPVSWGVVSCTSDPLSSRASGTLDFPASTTGDPISTELFEGWNARIHVVPSAAPDTQTCSNPNSSSSFEVENTLSGFIDVGGAALQRIPRP